MCGIAGIFQATLEADEVARCLTAMSDAMAYRGPDDAGMLAEHGAGLAMCRLAIIDVEGGSQPVTNEDGTVSLVMNGEIYNYRELGTRLRRNGHAMRSASDTEVAVHDFEQSRGAFPSDLRGMFALAAWDRSRTSVTLAVDRLGIKPLYFVADKQRLVFASEMRSLLASGLVTPVLDPEALAQYFTYGYVASPRSILRGVQRLRAGEALQWSPLEGPQIRRYWDLPAATEPWGGSAAELRTEIRRRLRDAVKSHLVSDVPLGALLSGGVDSSAIVALMSEAGAAPVRTFSIGFADPGYDELPYARRVARRFGTDHTEVVLEPSHVEVLEDVVRHFGEPFADPAALPTYFVSKLASQSVKVALSGDGADELFMGYTLFRGLDVARHAQALPGCVRNAVAALSRSLPVAGLPQWDDRVRHVAKRVADSMLSPAQAFRSKSRPAGAEAAVHCLSAEVRRVFARTAPFEAFAAAGNRTPGSFGGDPLQPFVDAGMAVSLPDDMLVKVDRMSMAHSLEVRVPFLDHQLVEFVSKLPVRTRMPHFKLKWLLRDSMRGLLPDEILDRPKHGFGVPLSAWFRNDLAGYARNLLLSGEARGSGFYDSAALANLFDQHSSNRGDFSGGIWLLVIFEIWRAGLGLEAALA